MGTMSQKQLKVSHLIEELARARKLEAVGSALLDGQERRLARLKMTKTHRDLSERLLNTMRDTQALHTGHVRHLESELRDAKEK